MDDISALRRIFKAGHHHSRILWRKQKKAAKEGEWIVGSKKKKAKVKENGGKKVAPERVRFARKILGD